MSDDSALREIPVCVDRLAARYAAPPMDREIAAAREEFDRRRGAVCDDEEMFEGHMAGFLEWYVIERPVADKPPPVVQALGSADVDDLGGVTLLRALALSHHSLFEVLDPRLSRPPGIRLLDLWGGGLWRVDQDAEMAGLVGGDIFEARLVPWQGRVRFGPVFCYHPREARQSIHALVTRSRAAGSARQDLLCELGRMRLKLSRCRNMPANRIYVPERGATP